MSTNTLDDKGGLDFLATPPESNLDSLFDFNFEPFQSSSDITSNESSDFFDQLSSAPSKDFTSFEHSPLPALSSSYKPNHSWRADSWRHHTVDTVPKSQRLVHKLRRDDVAISGSELLNLEGKISGTCETSSQGIDQASSPIEQSQQHRSRPPSPRGNTARSTRIAKAQTKWSRAESGQGKVMHPSSCYTHQRAHSLEDGFQRFNIQSADSLLSASGLQSDRIPGGHASGLTIKTQGSFNSSVQQTSNLERYGTNGELSLGTSVDRGSPQPQFSTPVWNGPKSSEEFPFGLTHAWENGATSPTINLYNDPEFQPPSSQPYPLGNSFTPSGPTGLGIQLDDPFNDSFPSGGFVEPALVGDTTFDDGSSDVSPGTAHARHFSNQSTAGSPSTSPTTPSSSKSRRRASRPSKSPRTPRTPKTPSSKGSGSGGFGGFVNFTPDDSRKILTGVAPSGSSKTKARRDREASEQRKRMGEAAAKAIRDAGGDVDQLIRGGLFPEDRRD